MVFSEINEQRNKIVQGVTLALGVLLKDPLADRLEVSVFHLYSFCFHLDLISCASLVAQRVKNLPTIQETRV